MKKIITLLLAVTVIGVLSYFVYDLNKNKGQSDTQLIEFSITETEDVDRVIINDANSYSFEIIKKDGIWTDKEGGCINQESANFIIDAFKNIEFKGYLAETELENAKKDMTAQHINVEIYKNGEWTKTWYIGNSTQDHYGQIMQLDSKEYGKSAFPVIMKIKGVHGIISPRFFADSRQWMCTNIFSLDINEISKVEVNTRDEPSRSFSVVKNGNDLKVYQEDKLLENVDTSMIYRYLNQYKKIHYESPNYELNPLQLDSLQKTTPFVVLTVTETSGKVNKLRCFRIKTSDATEKVGHIEFRDNDEDRFWCELPNGQIVKCQYFVFNPLLLGHIYFPMDESKFRTVDGIKTQ